MCIHTLISAVNTITPAYVFSRRLSFRWNIYIGGKAQKVWKRTKKTCMNQTEHRFDYPVNWVTQLVIVSDHQTNSHSYVCALAPFSSGAVPQRSAESKKELTGQGFKPISSSGAVAITTGAGVGGRGGEDHSLCHPPSKGGFIYVGCTCRVFFFLFPGVRRVTAKNSHQLACHFSVVFRLTPGFLWNVSAFSVTCKNPFQKCIYFEKCGKYPFQLGISVAQRDKTCAVRLEMWRQVWIIACTTQHSFLFLLLHVLSAKIIRNILLLHNKYLGGLIVMDCKAEQR